MPVLRPMPSVWSSLVVIGAIYALKGEWNGARASSLNRQWCVVYVIEDRAVEVWVLKVTLHDYLLKRSWQRRRV